MVESKNIVWTEKYRPSNAEDVCGNKDNYKGIVNIINEPGNILIYGPPGTGKTTIVRSLLKDISRESIFFFDMSLKSADTCKYMTRTLLNFVTKQTLKKNKILVVDEVDCMRVIDQKIFKSYLSKSVSSDYNYSLSLIFICNNINKVSDFITRNCHLLNFKTLQFVDVKKYLVNICKNENITYSSKALELIFEKCNNDLRNTVTTLQYIYMMYDVISEENYKKVFLSIDMDDRYLDTIFKMKIDDGVNKVYFEGISTLSFISRLLKYHKNKNKLTFEYIRVLAKASDSVINSNNVWFILYYVIRNSPFFLDKRIE